MASKITKEIFCAQCQLDTAHDCTLDKNQEIVATCSGCKRQIKFGIPKSPEHWNQLIGAHKASNVGQVSVEMAQAEADKHDARFKAALGISE